MNKDEARAAFVRILIEKVRADRNPSLTHMALIEQTLPREALPIYIEVLLE